MLWIIPRKGINEMKKLLIITILCTLILTVGCTQKVQRFGSVIGLKEEMLEKYKNLLAVHFI